MAGPGTLALESDALPTALRGPALVFIRNVYMTVQGYQVARVLTHKTYAEYAKVQVNTCNRLLSSKTGMNHKTVFDYNRIYMVVLEKKVSWKIFMN